MTIQPVNTNAEEVVDILSKKSLNQLIYTKLINTLYEFDVSKKKYQTKLKKLSKQVAKEITKKYQKKKVEERPTTESIDMDNQSVRDDIIFNSF